MKLKHFLRGLGAGVIFATLVLSISFSLNGYKMSEAAIVEEALELGMVWPDRDNSKDNEPATTPDEPDTSTTEAPTSSEVIESTSEIGSTAEPTTTPATATTEPTTPAETSSVKETTPEQTTVETPTSEPVTTETTTPVETTPEPESTTEEPPEIVAGKSIITVPKGMNSVQVAKLLETAGAVRDAYDFDAYIVRQGYGGRIQIGRHEIPLGSSYDEIIKIICGLK